MSDPLAWGILTALCLLAVSARAQEPAITGAQVNEAKVARTFYVDPSNADSVDDADHGTEEAPFKTIGRGVQAAAAEQDRGVGARVIISDGIYREAVRVPPATGNSDAPLVIEAANREQAIIDGADTIGWEAAAWKQEGLRWTHPWAGAPAAVPAKRAAAEAGTPCKPLAGNVLVFLDGVALRQVAEPMELGAGEFCVAPPPPETGRRRPRGEPPAAGAIVVQPPGGEGLSGAALEVSVQERAFTVEGRRNVVIRGLTVQHMAGAALVVTGCSNVLIDDVLCQWNNDAGLRIAGRTAAPWSAGVTLRRVRLLFNGASGLVASNLKNLAVEDSETSFNGFRGRWSDCIDPAGPAGSKVTGIHGAAWRRHHAVGNTARGMWWAGDCADITVEDSFCRANFVSGMFFENSGGPFTVGHCAITGTKSHPSVRGEAASPAGVSICAASDVRLEGNIVAGNQMPQLGVWDVALGADAVNFETGARAPHRAERHRYRRNVFCGLDAEQPVYNLPTVDRTGKAPFTFYYGTLDADGNCYWNAGMAEAFCSFDKGYVRRPGADLAGWRAFLTTKAATGTTPEATSIWVDPLFVDPADGDFHLRSSSPAADWGLPSDEGSPGQ